MQRWPSTFLQNHQRIQPTGLVMISRTIRTDRHWSKLTKYFDPKDTILMDGVFNQDPGFPETLKKLHPTLSRSSRIVAVLYNPYLKPFYRFGKPKVFLTEQSLKNIAKLCGYEVV